MKQIKLPMMSAIKPTPGSPVNLGVAFNNFKAVQVNSQNILSATFFVEAQLERIITYRVFGKFGPEVSFFNHHILVSDWFSFSAKRKLVVFIVNEKKYLSGKDKGELEKLLRKVMSYRNTFAHGRVVEKSDGTYISYFENTQREEILTDQYWTCVEKTFLETLEKLNEVQTKMGLSSSTV